MGISSCSLPSPSIGYVYCTDTILDREKADTLDLTNQSLQRMTTDRSALNQSPRKPEPPAPERRQPLQQREKERKGGMDSERGQTATS
jgi:hypothetical protein